MRKVKVGDKIQIIEMLGEPNYTGRVGIVEFIDSMGQLHGTWGGLAVQEENDQYIVIEGWERKQKRRKQNDKTRVHDKA